MQPLSFSGTGCRFVPCGKAFGLVRWTYPLVFYLQAALLFEGRLNLAKAILVKFAALVVGLCLLGKAFGLERRIYSHSPLFCERRSFTVVSEFDLGLLYLFNPAPVEASVFWEGLLLCIVSAALVPLHWAIYLLCLSASHASFRTLNSIGPPSLHCGIGSRFVPCEQACGLVHWGYSPCLLFWKPFFYLRSVSIWKGPSSFPSGSGCRFVSFGEAFGLEPHLLTFFFFV